MLRTMTRSKVFHGSDAKSLPPCETSLRPVSAENAIMKKRSMALSANGRSACPSLVRKPSSSSSPSTHAFATISTSIVSLNAADSHARAIRWRAAPSTLFGVGPSQNAWTRDGRVRSSDSCSRKSVSMWLSSVSSSQSVSSSSSSIPSSSTMSSSMPRRASSSAAASSNTVWSTTVSRVFGGGAAAVGFGAAPRPALEYVSDAVLSGLSP